MGAFADLIPNSPQSTGMFDDLIPGGTNPVPAPPLVGAGPGGSDLEWDDQGYIPPVEASPEAPAPLSDDRIGPGFPSLRALQITGQSAGRGVSEAVFGLGDLVNGLINAAGGLVDRNPGLAYPSEIVRGKAGQAMEAVGVAPIEEADMSSAERGAYTVGRMATSALTGGGALATGAKRIPTPQYPSRMDPLLDPYRQNAPRALATDTAAGAGAGAGNAMYNEAVPEESRGPLSELIATLLGGLGGAGAGNVARSGAKGAVDAAKRVVAGSKYDKEIPLDYGNAEPGAGAIGVPTTKRVARDAGAYLQTEASDPKQALQNLEANQKYYSERGLPEPSIGALTGDTGLVGVDRNVRRMAPAPAIERDRGMRAAQSEQLDKMAPDVPEGDRRAAQEFAEDTAGKLRGDAAASKSEIQGKVSDLETQIDASKQRAEDLAAPVQATAGTKEETSIRARGLVEGQKAATKAVADELYDKVDPTTPVTFGNTVSAAQSAKSSVGQTGTVPGIIDRIIRVRAEADGPQPFSEMKADLENINGAIRMAEQSGDSVSVRLLNEVKDGVLKDMDAAGESNVALKEAREFYSKEYGPKFKDGASKQALGPKGLDSKTLATYTANKEGADQLRSILKDDPAGGETVRNYVYSQLASKMSADPSPKQIRQFIDGNSHLWDAFPEVKKNLDALHKDVLNNRVSRDDLKAWRAELKRDLGYAEKNAADVEQVINRGVLRKFLDNDPENAVKAVLESGDPEKQMADALALITKDKTGRAAKAFKASVRDFLKNKFTGTRAEGTTTDDFAVLQSKMEGFLKKPGVEKAIDAVWKDDPGAMDAMKTARKISRDMAKLNQQAVAGSQTSESMASMNKMLRAVETVMRPIYGQLRTGGHMRTLRLAINQIPGLNDVQEVQRLLERAAFDGDLAKHLLGLDAVKMPQKTWTPKLNRLLGYAESARAVKQEDDDE